MIKTGRTYDQIYNFEPVFADKLSGAVGVPKHRGKGNEKDSGRECPGIEWEQSYVTMGQYDTVDIVEANERSEVEKAALIIRGFGGATTETLPATLWKAFLDRL